MSRKRTGFCRMVERIPEDSAWFLRRDIVNDEMVDGALGREVDGRRCSQYAQRWALKKGHPIAEVSPSCACIAAG